MPRFILRYKGADATPAADLDKVRQVEGISILDQSARMVLVDAAEPSLRAVADGLKDWSLIPESTVPLPDPRPRLRRKK